MPLKASVSGIRGTIGDSLTPETIVAYCSSFSQILPPGPIVVGRDTRSSGFMVRSLVVGVLTACGRDVIDVGIAPTPLVLYAVGENGYAGGIVITASHNPQNWNALKLINNKGRFLSPEEFSKLNKIYENGQSQYTTFDRIGTYLERTDYLEARHKAITDFIDFDNIKKSNLEVVIDPVNGAGSVDTEIFLNKLGCKVGKIHAEMTGVFGREPEPTPEHLADLSQEVKKTGSDIGFALDPDADRLVLCDENGVLLSEELTLALCVEHFLSTHKKGDVVINMSTSRIIEDIAAKHQVSCVRVPTGEIHVTEKLFEIEGVIGGEGNGGVIVPDINTCRDALLGIGLICEMLALRKKSLSEIVAELPQYIIVKEKMVLDNDINLLQFSEQLALDFKAQSVDTIDGIRLDLDDAWVLIRKSNTEPIVRIFAEARDIKVAEKLVHKTMKKVKEFLD